MKQFKSLFISQIHFLLQVRKFGCLLFGGDGRRGGDQIFRLKHAHVPDLHELEPVSGGVLPGIVHADFGALHGDRGTGGDEFGQIQGPFHCFFGGLKETTDESEL